MKDLFIGSEGTLGIITEVLLKLLPRPAARRTMLALYDRIEDAAETVSAIIAARIIPCTLEFLDRDDRAIGGRVRARRPADRLRRDSADGDRRSPGGGRRRSGANGRDRAPHGARDVRAARDEDEALTLAAAQTQRLLRPGAPATDDDSRGRHRAAKRAGDDGVVHRGDGARRTGLQIGTFGHMGDGNLHPTFLTDERDADEMERVHQALDAIVARTLELGGTITGEHGVGLAKKAWLRAADGRRAASS